MHSLLRVPHVQPNSATVGKVAQGPKGAAHLRVELEEFAEGDVVDDVAAQLGAVKGCKRAEAAVQRHILRCYHVIVAAAQLRRHLWAQQKTR